MPSPESVVTVTATVSVLLAACAATTDLTTRPLDAGEAFQYHATQSAIVEAARQAITDAKFALESEQTPDDSTTVLIGTRATTTPRGFEKVSVRIVARQVSDSVTTVHLVGQKQTIQSGHRTRVTQVHVHQLIPSFAAHRRWRAVNKRP